MSCHGTQFQYGQQRVSSDEELERYLRVSYMKQFPITHIYKVKNHEQIKSFTNTLIDELIEEAPKDYETELLTLSDFDKRTKGDKYQKVVTPHLQPYIEDYARRWGYKNIEGLTMWFARYTKAMRIPHTEGTYAWHGHTQGNMSAVYMMELPKSSDATSFLGIDMPEIVEGDLVCFPAMIPHRTPVILHGQKTVIAMTFSGVNMDQIWAERTYNEN